MCSLSDSVFFLFLRGLCPIEMGDFLGEMSEVYPDHDLISFYSSGCKAYALKLREKRTGKIETVVKVKGITFNRDTSKTLTFDRFKVIWAALYLLVINHLSHVQEMVNNYGDSATLRVKADVFRPNAVRGQVKTQPLEKTFKVVFDKAMVTNELNCVPFGYIGPFPEIGCH